MLMKLASFKAETFREMNLFLLLILAVIHHNESEKVPEGNESKVHQEILLQIWQPMIKAFVASLGHTQQKLDRIEGLIKELNHKQKQFEESTFQQMQELNSTFVSMMENLRQTLCEDVSMTTILPTARPSTVMTTMMSPINDSTNQSLYMVILLKNHLENRITNYELVTIVTKSSSTITIKDLGHSDFKETIIKTGVNSFNYSRNFMMRENMVESTKSMVLETSRPLSVFTLNYRKYMSDGSWVFPTAKCSTRYIVPSYQPSSINNKQSLIGIGSMQNTTKITIVLNINDGGTIVIEGNTYRSGDSVKITLQQYETFQLACDHDLTGTELTSSLPVCVFAGTTCSKVVQPGCSHLEEMIPPTTAFSDLFIVPSLYNQQQSVIRVVSDSVDTKVSVNNDIISLKEKKYNDSTLNHNTPNTIMSNKPILVMLYAIGYNADPFMMTIPAINQYVDEYQFYVPDAGFTSYLSLVIKASKLSGLRLNNNIISHSNDSSIFVLVNYDRYVTFTMDITSGAHCMKHIRGENFGLFVYGRKKYDGYGYPAGYNF